MNAFEKFVAFLQSTMETPQAYGWFHLSSIVFVVVLTTLMALILRNKSEKIIRIVVLVYAIICLLLEVYKQIVFSFDANTGVWDYQWYAFPFQFCSTPMYVALIGASLKKGKVQESLYSFLATFGLLGGILVMIMPGDVFISMIGINIQTMVHHGGQLFIGVILLTTKTVKLDLKTTLRALPTFVALVAVALTLNLTMVNFIGGETFNMFFISPHFNSTLPIFADIQPQVPYILFLAIYIAAFTVGAYIINLLTLVIKKFFGLFKRTKNA